MAYRGGGGFNGGTTFPNGDPLIPWGPSINPTRGGDLGGTGWVGGPDPFTGGTVSFGPNPDPGGLPTFPTDTWRPTVPWGPDIPVNDPTTFPTNLPTNISERWTEWSKLNPGKTFAAFLATLGGGIGTGILVDEDGNPIAPPPGNAPPGSSTGSPNLSPNNPDNPMGGDGTRGGTYPPNLYPNQPPAGGNQPPPGGKPKPPVVTMPPDYPAELNVPPGYFASAAGLCRPWSAAERAILREYYKQKKRARDSAIRRQCCPKPKMTQQCPCDDCQPKYKSKSKTTATSCSCV